MSGWGRSGAGEELGTLQSKTFLDVRAKIF